MSGSYYVIVYNPECSRDTDHYRVPVDQVTPEELVEMHKGFGNLTYEFMDAFVEKINNCESSRNGVYEGGSIAGVFVWT